MHWHSLVTCAALITTSACKSSLLSVHSSHTSLLSSSSSSSSSCFVSHLQRSESGSQVSSCQTCLLSWSWFANHPGNNWWRVDIPGTSRSKLTAWQLTNQITGKIQSLFLRESDRVKNPELLFSELTEFRGRVISPVSSMINYIASYKKQSVKCCKKFRFFNFQQVSWLVVSVSRLISTAQPSSAPNSVFACSPLPLKHTENQELHHFMSSSVDVKWCHSSFTWCCHDNQIKIPPTFSGFSLRWKTKGRVEPSCGNL